MCPTLKMHPSTGSARGTQCCFVPCCYLCFAALPARLLIPWDRENPWRLHLTVAHSPRTCAHSRIKEESWSRFLHSWGWLDVEWSYLLTADENWIAILGVMTAWNNWWHISKIVWGKRANKAALHCISSRNKDYISSHIATRKGELVFPASCATETGVEHYKNIFKLSSSQRLH